MTTLDYVSARCKREPPQGKATTPCWIWTLATAKSSGVQRPVCRIPGESTQRVRTMVLCEKMNWRHMPRGTHSLAICGRDLCCNPDHLVPGKLVMKAVRS
jgi:hypothetical protein